MSPDTEEKEYVLVCYKNTTPKPTLELFHSKVKEEVGQEWMHRLMENTQLPDDPPWEIALTVNGVQSDIESPEKLFMTNREALSETFKTFAANMAAILSINEDGEKEATD